ncbi:hypothetical protein EMCRGX_G015802 [Ephydatia muelleri]
MRQIFCQIVGDNLKGEIAPFSFPLPSGGEEVKGSPALVYIPHLVDMVVHLLDENESCFEAGDSVTNLHVALDHFKDQVEHLHEMKWSDEKYSQELKNLSLLQAELEKAQQSHEELQNMATYMALVNGEKSPLAVKLLTQSVAKTKSVKALKAKVAKGIATVQKGFSEKEGPFVKQLDSGLQLIGVQRQQYFGGAFVGNHVHKALKLPNVKTLCTAISQMAQEKLPHRSGEVAENMKNFINLFSLFGKCHNISDQNFIDEPQIRALDQAIQELMAFFRSNCNSPNQNALNGRPCCTVGSSISCWLWSLRRTGCGVHTCQVYST